MRKIELKHMLPRKGAAQDALPQDPKSAQLDLLRAMGGEVANLHAGTARDPAALKHWLKDREAEAGDGAWLLAAARAAEQRVRKAHEEFRRDPALVEEVP
jgi:hypothetical protein